VFVRDHPQQGIRAAMRRRRPECQVNALLPRPGAGLGDERNLLRGGRRRGHVRRADERAGVRAIAQHQGERAAHADRGISLDRRGQRLRCHRRLPKVIDHRCDAMANHFGRADLDREPHEVRRQRIERRPHRPHPFGQASALRAPARQIFRRMGVGVDEARYDEPAAGRDQLARGMTRERPRRREADDATVLDREIGSL
jgi:hypothetical protein